MVVQLRFVLCVLSVFGAAGAFAASQHFSRESLRAEVLAEGELARGVKIDGATVPAGADLEAWVTERAARVLDREITLKDGEQTLAHTSLRELGATADVDAAVRDAARVGHEGDQRRRILEAREAASFDVPLRYALPSDEVAKHLADRKDETDARPRNARKITSPEGARFIDHADGSYLDAFATTEALLRASSTGCDDAGCSPVELDVRRLTWQPAATKATLAAANIATNLGAFETKFGGAPGRNKNIERGASQLDGVVIMPGETISFNELVGPRTTDNGFFPAPEIYKGEMREGIGGGACQVASTVYAAAFYAGLTVEERRNHSRPSAYIRSGLDATVSYPVLDLRIKNPFDFPVLLSAKAEEGVMRAEFFGEQREVNVTLATQTKAILKYSRKLERSGFLPAGEYRVKQKGKRGLSIARKKTLEHLATGAVTVEESVDIYPPTQEILLVAPGLKEADLPPFEPET